MGNQPRITCSGQQAIGPHRVREESRGQRISVRESAVLHSRPWWLEYPLVWLDAAGRPDVADLERVLLWEGNGEGVANWRNEHNLAGEWACVLHVQVSRPVLASFDIPFDLPSRQRVLEVVARARELFLYLDLEAAGWKRVLSWLFSATGVIRIEFDPLARDELADCLMWWKQLQVS